MVPELSAAGLYVEPGALAAYRSGHQLDDDSAFETIVCGSDTTATGTLALRLCFDRTVTIRSCHYGAGMHAVYMP